MNDLCLRRVGAVAYFVFEKLESFPFLTHAFSTRKNGISPFPSAALNLSYIQEDIPENVDSNRAQFFAALGRRDMTLVTLHQVHSNQIHILNKDGAKSKPFFGGADRRDPDPSRLGDGDGLMTDRPGYWLGIQTADCLPILLVDPTRRAIANLHAGWRGTQSRIVEHGVKALRRSYGSRPQDLIAAIGPGIGVCCYEVGDEVVAAFRREFPYAGELFQRPPGAMRPHLDLAQANKKQLLASGLSETQILQAQRCTACDPDWFFSHRREKGKTGRMLAVVGLTEP